MVDVTKGLAVLFVFVFLMINALILAVGFWKYIGWIQ